MHIIEKILIGIVALEHIYILWLEMFAWETAGKKAFRSIPKELFGPTKVFAANQGLYNGFLAAGLIWTLIIQDTEWAQNIALFFLGCVAVAGIYGGATADKGIFVKQGVPAIIAIVVVLMVG